MTFLAALMLTACDDAGVSGTEDSASGAVSACDVDLTATGWSAETHLKGVDGDYDLLFDDETVHRIDITICSGDYANMQDDLESLYGDSGGMPGGDGGGPPDGGGDAGGGPADAESDPIYVPVTIGFDGQTWPVVGMRHKGNSSLMQPYNEGVTKLPFRLNFDYYDDAYSEVDDQRFHGFEELKFGNGYGDDSLVRDKVAADLYRDAGIPAAKGALVEIYVDVGEGPVYWGAYTMFEDPCGELLDSWFDDDDGSCYKADGDGATFATFDADSFGDKTNDTTDAVEIAALVEALNDTGIDAADWRAGLEETLDVDGFLRALAVNNLIGNWDTYGLMTHNFYLYADPAQDGRLVWVPWDLNLSYAASNIRTPMSVTMDEVTSDWPLIRSLMDDDVYAAAYYGHIEELLAGPLSAEAQKERFETAHALIADSAEAESGSYTNITGSFEDALESSDDAVFDWIDDVVEEAESAL
ncbi:MAG: spore coat protein H [Myxococcota bacterium]|jgi:spore coat protein H